VSDLPPLRFDGGRNAGQAFRSMMERGAARRAKVTSQSWPEFFRRLALEVLVVAGIVAVLALVFWLLHRG
jgi:hypothetical protein